MTGAPNLATFLDRANDPVQREARRKREEALDADVENILQKMPGREPTWDEDKRLQIDKIALHRGMRMILWDDDDSGFYMWMRWDWSKNQPEMPPEGETTNQLGWYSNYKQMMQAPLLDTSVPDDQLAQWIDEHTMRVHRFLNHLTKVRRNNIHGTAQVPQSHGEGQQPIPILQAPGNHGDDIAMWVLDNEYGQALTCQEFS